MTATLERPDVVETALVAIDVDDYLDVRQPAWTVLEKAGAVEARDRQVYVKAELAEVLAAISRAFPGKYAPSGPPAGGEDG
jgi:hypothetical protein